MHGPIFVFKKSAKGCVRIVKIDAVSKLKMYKTECTNVRFRNKMFGRDSDGMNLASVENVWIPTII